MKKVLKIENLDCANCARKLEDKLSKIKGVNECQVSFMSQKITIDVNEDMLDETLNNVKKTCKRVEPDMKILN